MNRYARTASTKNTPLNQPIPGSGQVQNSDGAFVWQVDDWALLDRFLILGTEKGSYYAGEKAMTLKATEAVIRLIKSHGPVVVARVVEISKYKRAPKNDPAIFVLALAAKTGDALTRGMALANVPVVCRTGTHLFQFVSALEEFGGWGRATKRAISNWYLDKDADKLAYQLVKYRQRGGWSHRDVLRKAKPISHSNLIRWAVGKEVANLHPTIDAFTRLQAATSVGDVLAVLKDTPTMPWETVPSQFLNSPEVWEALLQHMGLTAVVRNLGKMTSIGLLSQMSAATKTVVQMLTDQERVVKEGVHPIAALTALMVYSSGHGIKGDLTWDPVRKIVDALDSTFYHGFGAIRSTGKRICVALDVSGSMGNGAVSGVVGLTPRIASAAMSMVTARSENDYALVAFQNTLTELSISPRQRLDDVVKTIDRLDFSSTDCSLPMRWALEHKHQFDVFIVYTDNETNEGGHPSQSLRKYRDKTGINAKFIVVGMVANDFSIADPKDSGMMDVVGFDTATPNLMSNFIRGE